MKTYPAHILVFFGLIFTSCGQNTFEEKMSSIYKGTVPLIKSTDVLGLSDVVLLDTRSPREFNISHLKGAQMVDYDGFNASDVEGIDKNQEVIVYCSVGYRSERIGEKLQKMGFTNVKNLYGGIFDWKNQGFEVVNRANQETDSVHTYNKSWSKWLYKGIKVYE